jgi:uncharacterized membrane protein
VVSTSAYLARPVRRPLHAALAQFPTVCFTLTLATDIAYWRTVNLMWLNFSSWLLFAGLVAGGLALAVAVVELLVRPGVRATRSAGRHAGGSFVILCVALLNSFVHAADGWTAVVPWGLALSALTVALILLTAWLGREEIRHV